MQYALALSQQRGLKRSLAALGSEDGEDEDEDLHLLAGAGGGAV